MPFVVKVICLLVGVLLPVMASAEASPADRARDAIGQLDAAAIALADAESGRDRVRALTSVVRAYEVGLNGLRSSLRAVALHEAELSGDLAARDAEIAALLLTLQRLGNVGSPVSLLHPAGPEGSVRAGLLVAQVAPALKREADALRADLDELRSLQALQTEAETTLQFGLEAVQTARADLNQAIADRVPLPKQFLADPVREAILISSADTLDAFAAGLDELSAQSIAAPQASLYQVQPGTLELPVRGHVLRSADEADAVGIERPGLIIATDTEALVVSPVPATLRYVGPLLDFGEVMILEPQENILFVFAGIGIPYVQTGDVVDAGAPLGLMGTASQKSAIDLSTDGDEAGAARPETLYIEVRQDNTPEDPSLWFRTDKDG